MEQKQIDRINELARKAKTPEGLTEWEEMERAALRREYIDCLLYTSPISGRIGSCSPWTLSVR